MTLYRQIAIWKAVSESKAVRYHLIEDLSERRFAIQSCDHFGPRMKYEYILFFEKLFAERLVDFDGRNWFSSIEDAIENFEKPLPDLAPDLD